MIVVLHHMEDPRDDSVFGPFDYEEEARAFMADQQHICPGSDIVKVVIPVKVDRRYEFEIDADGDVVMPF